MSEEELGRLDEIGRLLGVRYEQLPTSSAAHFRNLLALKRIREGVLPVLAPADLPVVISSTETPHLFTRCCVREERVVAREWRGGSRGVSVRVARGARLRMGASRGVSLPVTDLVVVSSGHLLLSSERIAYLADKKAFNAPWKRVTAVEPFNNAVRIHLDGRSTVPTLEYEDARVAAHVEGIVSHILGQSNP